MPRDSWHPWIRGCVRRAGGCGAARRPKSSCHQWAPQHAVRTRTRRRRPGRGARAPRGPDQSWSAGRSVAAATARRRRRCRGPSRCMSTTMCGAAAVRPCRLQHCFAAAAAAAALPWAHRHRRRRCSPRRPPRRTGRASTHRDGCRPPRPRRRHHRRCHHRRCRRAWPCLHRHRRHRRLRLRLRLRLRRRRRPQRSPPRADCCRSGCPSLARRLAHRTQQLLL